MTVAGAAPFGLALADGRAVRLADVELAPGAAEALDRFAGRAGALHALPEPDRYGRPVGDVVLQDTGVGVREALVGAGLAFVDPVVMSEACLQGLLRVERDAARERRGAWGRAPVRQADDPGLASGAGEWAIVEGTVRSLGERGATIYLNFGRSYATDFTVIVRREDARGWGDRLKALDGRAVRVRGVLDSWNGALIRVTHPAQIEAVSDGGAGGTAPSR